MVKNLPAVQETWLQSLDREDPLEEGMATHSSTLAWRSPWTEEPGGLQSMGLQRVGHHHHLGGTCPVPILRWHIDERWDVSCTCVLLTVW